MEIRFCDRCHESIPDGDFDAGRAVSIDGRSLHVACALHRAAAGRSYRSWLGFLLALAALGISTFLLVRTLNDDGGVTTAVQARIDDAVADARAAAAAEEAARADALAGRIEALIAERIAAERTQRRTDLEALDRRLLQTGSMLQGSLSDLQRRQGTLDEEVRKLNAFVRDVADRTAAELARRREEEATASAAPPPDAPPANAAPEAPPAGPPAPGPDGPAARVEADPAEVDRWIERLKDPNAGIAFSATMELGELGDPRAVPPLIDALKGHRDYFVRLGAATALGMLLALDAVPALIEALDDKEDLVRAAANQSLIAITEQDFEFVATMSPSERSKVMTKWRQWWKANEQPLRARRGP
jgi:hypothetical protein